MSPERDMDEHDDLLAAEYALGTLPHAERAAFEARMAGDAGLRARVARWESHFSPLADGIEPVAPPDSVLDAVEGRLFGAPARPAGWWDSIRLWRALAIASLTAIVALTIIYSQLILPPAPQPTFVTEMSGETSDLRILALYDAGTGTLRLHRTAGTPASGRAFQLWIIAGDGAPVSLGVLPANAGSTHNVPGAVRPLFFETAVLAVSDEPAGGSPTGQPTGAVLATGAVVPI